MSLGNAGRRQVSTCRLWEPGKLWKRSLRASSCVAAATGIERRVLRGTKNLLQPDVDRRVTVFGAIRTACLINRACRVRLLAKIFHPLELVLTSTVDLPSELWKGRISPHHEAITMVNVLDHVGLQAPSAHDHAI